MACVEATRTPRYQRATRVWRTRRLADYATLMNSSCTVEDVADFDDGGTHCLGATTCNIARRYATRLEVVLTLASRY
jgi:hypothetical protein